jgi:thiamine-phosphate pyrophosphorylase
MRTLDAAANRAGEGLRVVEDFVRFALDDRHLTQHCKSLRHDLAVAVAKIPVDQRLACRDTPGDVGTEVTTTGEQTRHCGADVAVASLKRSQQALRSLEEFGKVIDPALAASFEQIRYRTYTLERAIHATHANRERFADTRLYVLVDGRGSDEELASLIESIIAAGADAIQLRDKTLTDRVLLRRARVARQATSQTGALLIINDRPDLAALSRADGVHIGQDDLSVKDARTVVGPSALVGVSTHTIEQARAAVLDGADYLGCGPTFATPTKKFEQLAGPELLAQVAAEIRLPAFAIGGINMSNLAQVMAAGFSKVAASSAVTAADDPAAAAGQLRKHLEGRS